MEAAVRLVDLLLTEASALHTGPGSSVHPWSCLILPAWIEMNMAPVQQAAPNCLVHFSSVWQWVNVSTLESSIWSQGLDGESGCMCV